LPACQALFSASASGVSPGSVQNATLTPTPAIVEYQDPGPGCPTDIATGPDGNIWFTEPCGHPLIGYVTTSGAFTEFSTSGNPYGIAAGPDGNVWFADNGAGRIGSVTPSGT